MNKKYILVYVCVLHADMQIGNNGREPNFYNFVIFVIVVSDLLVFRILSLYCGIGQKLYLDNLFCSCAGEVA